MSPKNRVLENNVETKSWWWLFRYIINPVLAITVLPFLIIFLVVLPLDAGLSRFSLVLFLGNTFSWSFITLLVSWAIVFLKALPLQSKKFYGPTTGFGQTPVYVANGFPYYCATLLVFVILNCVTPTFSLQLYQNMPELLGSLVVVAFVFCTYLWCKGKYHPESSETLTGYPTVFEFYCGLELHPYIFGVNVKQLTNCRVGLMLWQILILNFLFASYKLNGFNPGMLVCVLLQSVYLAKFFWWETGYFNTLDITLDRAGFYICWGCLAFLPLSYTYTTYYFVSHPPIIGCFTSLLVFIAGLATIGLNYEVDRQKEHFRKHGTIGGIWAPKVKSMEAEYRSGNGMKKSRLLLSGFWGFARHLNYLFEMLASIFWNLPGLGLGPIPFLYNIYLTILLTHRIFRDEEKCEKKYGPFWKQYCEKVPYRLVPYIF